MTTTHQRRAQQERSAIGMMYTGLGLTIVAMIAPFVDHATVDTLAGHIRDGYPGYTQARINSAATLYLVYLSIIGVLGIASWLWAAWAVKAGKRWARGASTALFLLGTGIALLDLTVRDTSGETGLPPLLGAVGVLPCLAGLLAVMLLWRRS